MNRYEKYKRTNIEWIGIIPEHWEVKKLKYIGESLIGITYSPDDISDEENGILVLRSSNIQDGKLAFEDCVYVNKEIKEKHLTKEGDVLLCARNGSAHLVGKSALIRKEHNNITWGAFMSIFRSSIGEFAYQFFNSQIFKSQTGLFSTSTINQLTTDTLNNLFVPVPPPKEQTDIANYLHKKTAQIDKLIANKERLIELLKEERTVIINKAVSGEGKNWERKKLKYVANLKSGDSITSDSIRPEGDYPVFGGNGLRGYTSKYTHEGGYVLIGRQGALCGNINYANGKFFASEHAVVVTPLDESVLIWLGELLRSMNLNQYSIASAQPGLSVERIQNLSIAVPSIQEQKQVATFIQSETQRIDNTISKIETEIDLMMEYKAALISEVVTGKQKVIK